MAVLHSFITDDSMCKDLVIEVKHLLLNIISLGLVIQFCWIPAGIYGDSIADKLAKKSTGIRPNRYSHSIGGKSPQRG